MKALGMAAVEGSEVLEDTRAKHVLLLSGAFIDSSTPVLARLRMRLVAHQGCAVELTVRSEAAPVARSLANVLLT